MHSIEYPYHYTVTEHLHDYHCDKKQKLKISYLLKLIEVVSTGHLLQLKLPYQTLYEEGIIFLMSKMTVHIYRRPNTEEKIKLTTGPQRIIGAQFYREIALEDEKGQRIADAMTNWFVAEPATRKVLRPEAFQHEMPLVPPAERLVHIDPRERIAAHGPQILRDERLVRYSDLDINGHMNNTVYADVVTDCLPTHILETMEPKKLIINYKNEALLGDTLELAVFDNSMGVYYVECQKAQDVCFQAQMEYGVE